MSKKRVGILALQGCVIPHIQHIETIGAEARLIRQVGELDAVDALILPGGESTTMLRLLHSTGLEEALIKFKDLRPIWGICAGAILMASEVVNPSQKSFSIVPLRATRNAYGSQIYSFKAHIDSPWDSEAKCVDFIRAPKLEPLSEKVKELAAYQGDPVLLRYDNILVSAFHTELGTDPWMHHKLISMC